MLSSVEIAATMRAARPDSLGDIHNQLYADKLSQWRYDCLVLARAQINADPQFDHVPFLVACGIPENEAKTAPLRNYP